MVGAQEHVLIIIPAYNEAVNLPGLVRELRTLYPAYDRVVIDDGSKDGTKEIVRALPTRLVSLPYNLGIGSAVQTGLQIALKEGYDTAVLVDADGQHPPQEVRRLLGAMKESGCDLVLGSRFILRDGYQSSFVRRFGIRLFSWLLSIICHTKITDATSGFRAVNHRAIQVLAGSYQEEYPGVEGILSVDRAGLQITEVPVRMLKRQAGRSSIGTLQSISFMIKVPLAVFMNLVRELKPKSTE